MIGLDRSRERKKCVNISAWVWDEYGVCTWCACVRTLKMYCAIYFSYHRSTLQQKVYAVIRRAFYVPPSWGSPQYFFPFCTNWISTVWCVGCYFLLPEKKSCKTRIKSWNSDMDWQFPMRHKWTYKKKECSFRTKQQFINGLKRDIVFVLVSAPPHSVFLFSFENSIRIYLDGCYLLPPMPPMFNANMCIKTIQLKRNDFVLKYAKQRRKRI